MFNLNQSLRDIRPAGYSSTPAHEENKEPLPVDTRPISREEFLELMKKFRADKEFSFLPMPSFAYKEFDEFKGTEYERIDENVEYSKKQLEETDQEKRANNARDRLRKRLEEKKQIRDYEQMQKEFKKLLPNTKL